MTLVEAFTFLKEFAQTLEAIVLGGNFEYEEVLENDCLMVAVYMANIKKSIELNISGGVFVGNFLEFINYRLKKVYYNQSVNPVLIDNSIEYVDVSQATQWHIANMDNIDDYMDEINSLIEQASVSYMNVSNAFSELHRQILNN